MTITEFLEARIAEDEAVARKAAAEAPRWFYGTYGGNGVVRHQYVHGPRVHLDASGNDEWFGGGMVHIARYDPARILAECEAKRAALRARHILDQSAADDEWTWGSSDANYATLRALAAVYADHPDYQQEWRV